MVWLPTFVVMYPVAVGASGSGWMAVPRTMTLSVSPASNIIFVGHISTSKPALNAFAIAFEGRIN